MALKRIPNGNFDVVNAKGDLIAGVSTGAVTTVPVGTNNQILMANSSTTSGLSWSALPGTNWTLLNTGDTSVGTGILKTWSGLGGYDKYYVEVRTLVSSATIQPSFTMALNGGTGSATAMVRILELATSPGGTLSIVSSSFGGTSTTIDLGYNASNSGGMNASFYMEGALGSGPKRYSLHSMGTNFATYGARGRHHEGQYSLPLTSLSFATQTNAFAGGSVFIYGA
jgi:hypothetical protein